jgi:hypothetical protein
MQVETKFLWLFHAIELGDDLDGWEVCWLGGWDKCRVMFVVMVKRLPARVLPQDQTIHLAFGSNRATNGVTMNTFTIDPSNNIAAFASLEQARAAKINNARPSAAM